MSSKRINNANDMISVKELREYYSAKFDAILTEVFPDEPELFKEFIRGFSEVYTQQSLENVAAGCSQPDRKFIDEAAKHFIEYKDKFSELHPGFYTEEIEMKTLSVARAYQCMYLADEEPLTESRVQQLTAMKSAAEEQMFIIGGQPGMQFIERELALLDKALAQAKLSEFNKQPNLGNNLTVRWRKNDEIGLRKFIKGIARRISPRASDIESILNGKNVAYQIGPNKLDTFIWLIAELKRFDFITTSPTRGHFSLFEKLLLSDDDKRRKPGYFRKRASEIKSDPEAFRSVRNEVDALLKVLK